MEPLHYFDTIENLCIEHGKLEAIIESSTNAILELDSEGRIISWNPAFCDLFSLQIPKPGVSQLSETLGIDIASEIELLVGGKESLVVKDLSVPARGRMIEEKFIELKLIAIPRLQETNIIAIIRDKTDVIRALRNREEYITGLFNIIEELTIDNRETIYHLSSLVELRDYTTGAHLQRVEEYTRILASSYLQAYGKRDKWLNKDYVEDMALSAVLHDIGKVGVSDTILLKPGKLTEAEFEAIKQHTVIAGEALKKFRGKKDFLAMGREIAVAHHEHWDGSGYPQGLKGKAIPLSARIVALCDTYDALVNDRPYKLAYPLSP